MSIAVPPVRAAIACAFVFAAAALSAHAAPVYADEAYLCGSDKIIYVAVADLARMKRTDPCIAAYYGLTVGKAENPVRLKAIEKPAATASASTGAKKSAPPELKRLADDVPAVRGAPAKLALAAPPSTQPGTDYRHVKVINASVPADAIYYHTK